MADVVFPDPGTRAFFIDDECFLFSEPQQEITILNTSAAFIWCSLQEGKDLEEIEKEMQGSFGISNGDAKTFVRKAVAQWRERGFLAGTRRDNSSIVTRPEPICELPPRGFPHFVAERFYVLLGSRLHIQFTASEQAAAVVPILAHLESSSECEGDHVIDVVQTPERIILYKDGEGCLSCQQLDELAPLVKGLVWSTAVNRAKFFLALHAGVVCGPHGALLLPGQSGSGKSTLTALLVHAGFEYFSDEFALLQDGDMRVLPVPLALCIKETGFPVLARYFPSLFQIAIHSRFDGKRVAYLPPPRASLPSSDAARVVQEVIFPRYVAHAETACRPISKAQAVRLLLEQCLVVHESLNVGRVSALIKWIENVDCRELVFGAAEDCIPLVTRILAQSGS